MLFFSCNLLRQTKLNTDHMTHYFCFSSPTFTMCYWEIMILSMQFVLMMMAKVLPLSLEEMMALSGFIAGSHRAFRMDTLCEGTRANSFAVPD